MPPPSSPDAYRFGPFRLRVQDRILERGERIPLTPKVMDTLFVLVENAGKVVTKEALMKAVWPDVTVVESGLTRNISSLRKVLEEGQAEGSYIETIPRRGYRFVAEVTDERTGAEPDAAAVKQPAAGRTPRVWATSGALLLALLASLWMVVRSGPGGRRPEPEPLVRIGEHLLYKLAPEQSVRALEYFEEGARENPRSAAAQAGVAVSLLHLAGLGVRPVREILPRAEAAARKAVELNAQSSAAHYALGTIHTMKDWKFAAADAEYRRALELDPHSVQTRYGYARLKLAVGDVAGAMRLLEEALEEDPASPPLGAEYCLAFYFGRDFRRAESECAKVLDREPDYAIAHYYRGLSLAYLERYEEARGSLERTKLMPAVVEADLAWLKLRQGDRAPAAAILEQRRELVRKGKVDASAKLLLAAALGHTDEAFEALEAAYRNGAAELLGLRLEPRLDPIRNDARYAELLGRLGLRP